MKLDGKVALVTGASRGIGKATALALAEEGCTVIVNYMKESERAKKVVEAIQKIGQKAVAIKCDVSNEKQVEKMIEQIIKEFGKIDILVNNAGIVFDVPFFERTVEQWKRTLDVNLVGIFLTSKYVSKHMLKQKSGTIINVSSTNGIHTYHPDSIDYSASKAGVINATKSMAIQFSPYIRVNAIAPGWVETEMNGKLPAGYVKSEKAKVLLNRFADPKEMASVIVFLASNDASYMTGSVIVVDGGYP